MAEDIGIEGARNTIKDLVDMSIIIAEQREAGNKGEKEPGFDPGSLVSKLLADVILGGMSRDAD